MRVWRRRGQAKGGLSDEVTTLFARTVDGLWFDGASQRTIPNAEGSAQAVAKSSHGAPFGNVRWDRFEVILRFLL